MFYDILKEWKNNLISIILTIICTALQIGTNLLAIQQLQSIIEWNFEKFLAFYHTRTGVLGA